MRLTNDTMPEPIIRHTGQPDNPLRQYYIVVTIGNRIFSSSNSSFGFVDADAYRSSDEYETAVTEVLSSINWELSNAQEILDQYTRIMRSLGFE